MDFGGRHLSRVYARFDAEVYAFEEVLLVMFVSTFVLFLLMSD